MCQFLSALAFRDGSLFYLPEYTDSHSDLLLARGIKDEGDSRLKPWCRVEFTPKDHLFDQPDAYELKVDEEYTPGWFDDHREKFAAELRTAIDRMIVREDRDIILGGCVILSGDDTEIGQAVSAKLAAICGGTLNKMCGGTLNAMWGGTLNAMWGGTLNAMCGGTLNAMWGGTLNAMWGGTLNAMWGGTLNAMWGGTLNKMCGGTLNAMCGGTLNKMCGGTLNKMWGSTLNEIGKCAKIVTDHREAPATP